MILKFKNPDVARAALTYLTEEYINSNVDFGFRDNDIFVEGTIGVTGLTLLQIRAMAFADGYMAAKGA
jgi:hypothetical protein